MPETNFQSERQQAHFLLDALPEEKVPVVRSLLEVMVEPLSRSLAMAPVFHPVAALLGNQGSAVARDALVIQL